MKRLFQVLTIALVVVFLMATTGCYGSFSLVNKVHKWNGTLGNKWVNEVAFLAMCVVPVYEVAAFIDVVFLNLVEFWTGSSPMTTSIDLPQQKAAIAANADAGTLTFTSDDGTPVTVTRVTNGAEVRDAEGNLLARSVRTAEGVTVYDAQGRVAGTMTNAQIAEFASRK